MAGNLEFVTIDIAQIQVGLYIALDLKWMEHQFPTNSFKIRTQKQLAELRALGLKTIRYCPARSEAEPLSLRPEPAPPAPEILAEPILAEPILSVAEKTAIERKQQRAQRLNALRQSVSQCAKTYAKASESIRNINQHLYSKPEESLRAATDLIGQMAESLLIDKDIAIHLMNDKVAGEDVYFHSLNVAVLAMMLAREMKLSKAEIALVGLGAIFHDIGKSRIPDTILRKAEPLTQSERNFLALHTRYGEEIGRSLNLPKPVLDIILHHHEDMIGTGYPDKLDGQSLPRLTRITAIADAFDELCNESAASKPMTPYEAVSHMFSKQRALYDPGALGTFIRCMGIYPPGTLVSLADHMWGMVISVNVQQPLKPLIMVYDPDVPKEEAILLDLVEEPGMKIEKTYRPTDLPREVFEYLSPRHRVTYYFDEATERK